MALVGLRLPYHIPCLCSCVDTMRYVRIYQLNDVNLKLCLWLWLLLLQWWARGPLAHTAAGIRWQTSSVFVRRTTNWKNLEGGNTQAEISKNKWTGKQPGLQGCTLIATDTQPTVYNSSLCIHQKSSIYKIIWTTSNFTLGNQIKSASITVSYQVICFFLNG